MADAVIVSTARTPIGKAFRGIFNDTHAADMGAHVIKHAAERAKVDLAEVEDVILGCAAPEGTTGSNVARVSAMRAGAPVSVSGVTVNRFCSSGLQTISMAAQRVLVDKVPVMIAGGLESVSLVQGPPGGNKNRLVNPWVQEHVPGIYHSMIQTADTVAARYKISRQAQDEYSLQSQLRTAAAQQAGKFADEIVPITVRGRKSDTVVEHDEHIRPDASVEKLATLRPIMLRQDEAATVTAGNASGQNDGASVCIVTTPAKAEELGLRPLARLVSWGLAGVPPRTMGIGPVPAVAKALDVAGVALKDVDLIELNEAFAAQVLACTREWDFKDSDFDRLNVNGSGISLGHPVGATGGRILATMTREMARRDARYGLETMCIGGGQGLAALFERV